MSSSFSGSIALSSAAFAFDDTPFLIRPKMPIRDSVLAQVVLAVALAELIIRQPQESGRLLLLVARPLERVLAQPRLERLHPIGQRAVRIVEEAGAGRLGAHLRLGRQRRVDVVGGQ